MFSIEETFSIIKDFLPLITAGGFFVSATGLVPRIGPGRAVGIALRSRFTFKSKPESLRLTDINLLKSALSQKDFGQGYLVVTGEKGVGKTCLLNTVTSQTAGVIKVRAQTTDDANTIIKNTLLRLTRIQLNFIPPSESAKRVIFWYRLFTFGHSPIIVINAAERKVGQEYAGITGAVRTLVDDYNLRVIVDGSPNSLDESLMQTTREDVFEITPMDRESIWSLEQLQDLFKYVKEAGLDDTVFAVLGGIPSRYDNLWRKLEPRLHNGQDARQAIGTHLSAQISAAIKLLKDVQDMDEIIKLFDKEKCHIPSHLLKDKKLKRPTPDKVFREVNQGGVFLLIPSSNAIGIVLKHSLRKEPTLDELEELLKIKM